MSDTESIQSETSGRSPLVKWIRRVLFIILALLILGIMLLQFSPVQTWLSTKVTKYISEATNTTVTAERLKISPFDGIILQNFNVVDQQNDTIFYAGALNISLRKNLFHLLRNEIDLSYVGIKNLRLNIITETGESRSNLQKFLDNLSTSPSKKSAGPKMNFNVKDVDLSNLDIKFHNQNKGKVENIFLKSGTLDINYIDMGCNEYDINSAIFDEPVFRSHIYEFDCSPSDELAIDQIESTKAEVPDTESQPLTLTLREIVIKDGRFEKSNDLIIPEQRFKEYLDYNNFSFERINMLLEDFSLRNNSDVFAKLKTLSAVDNTGFVIRDIKSDTIIISPTSAELLGYTIEMGKTTIKDRLKFSFADFGAFSEFTDKVIIQSEFKDTRIFMDDLVHFIKSLSKVPFVVNNGKEIIEVNGRYFGKVNNLAGRDVDIKMGSKLSLAGSFNTRNLLDPDNTVLNIRLDRFDTSMKKIKMILPSFNLPPTFYKLGSIHFTGRFDGYIEDFVAYGKLKSDVGAAEMDMRLDITQGTNKANYSGTLNLQNFNMGLWSGNPDLGLVNFNSKVEDGKGLTLNTVKADLAATVKSLSFKKYEYKNFILDGKIDKNTFNGVFKIEDNNVDFVFDGSFEYLNNQAFLNFKSEVKRLDLQALNLSKVPLSFKANMDINLTGSNLNDFTGTLDINDLDMVSKDSAYNMKKISIISRNSIKGGKELKVDSDLGQIMIEGQYDIPNIVKSIKKIIRTNYPYITKNWKEDIVAGNTVQKFDFNINLTHSKNYLSLLGLYDSYFRKLDIKGRIDTYKNELSLASGIPFFKIKKDSLQDLQLLMTSNNSSGDILVHIDSTFAAGKRFNPIDLQTHLSGDTVNFELTTEKLIDSLENFDIRGQLIPHSKGYNLTLSDNLLVMLGTRWNIDPKNNVVLGNNYFSMDNMILSDGSRRIQLDDINNNKGVSLDIGHFDMDIINSVIKYDKMKLGGLTNVGFKINDVFQKEKEISCNINIPSFTINGDPYGILNIDLSKSKTLPVDAHISIGEFLDIKGTYDDKEKILDSKIKLKDAPMTILQYLLKDGIKDTDGYIDADLSISGPVKDLNIKGDGMVNKGKTTLVYTGVTYYFDKQKLKLTNTAIDLNGAQITDQNGNAGTIKGGLTHNRFKSFGVNASISGNNVVGLNTTKADNPDYYGYGVGQLSAEFIGLFEKVDMKINAVTGPGTRLFIPVDNSQTSINESFIKFVTKDKKGQPVLKKPFVVGGINIEMAITITPDADLSLIFNEAKGDIIKGKGRGNLKIDITRQGDFEIFGDYEIEQGEYLFTVALLPVAKPFVVERGGRITWTGDPVNATLDITANYQTRTSIKPFIEEYLSSASENTQALASQRSEVNLKLKLGGTLFKPDIKFDLSFPNLVSDVSTLADSKLRLLKSNELELNSNAMSLIVFNAFLPSNRVADVFGAAGLQSAGINTLSEFLSSQLSVYITNLLNSALEEDGLISGIDFEVGVRNNNLSFGNAATNNIFPDEIEVRLKNKFRFMDERFSLNVGGNYVFQNQGITINQVLPDFALEFLLTEDRKLKVRLYGKYDIDPISITSLREKYGLGVAYRTEFGNMVDFEKNVKNKVSEIIDK
ncbi:MAG: translocation/assembly module TamB domain-containing protein [Saprospiraceae bacterium]|nr:translocation/assembly module TamB domain-containing protein [Saprospiraceae bacterium]